VYDCSLMVCRALRAGTNYAADETVFDPTYGPPEKYLEVKGVVGRCRFTTGLPLVDCAWLTAREATSTL
jgi:hypothetical protein